jgi:hypothetical protein
MQNPENPINRFANCLNEPPASISNILGISLSTFQKQSAYKPIELQRLIEKQTPLIFSDDIGPQFKENISQMEKQRIVEDLLASHSAKSNSFHNYRLHSAKNTRIFKDFMTSGLPHFTVVDLTVGTPLSPNSNLLTYEFSTFLRLDKDWVDSFGKIVSVSGFNLKTVAEKCLTRNPEGITAMQFLNAVQEETNSVLADAKKLFQPELDFIRELTLTKSLFEQLKGLHEKRKSLAPKEFSYYERYKDWFVNQYNLSRKEFKKALKEGNIVIWDVRQLDLQAPPAEENSLVDLRVALLFHDSPPRLS